VLSVFLLQNTGPRSSFFLLNKQGLFANESGL
jgi:hypothetical protein